MRPTTVSALQLAAEPAAVVAEMVRVVRPTGLVLLATATCPRTGTPPADRVAGAPGALRGEDHGRIQRPGTRRFDVAELIALLAHPGATVIDTAVIDGLVVAVGQRSRSTGSG